jgi:hypothetical protein
MELCVEYVMFLLVMSTFRGFVFPHVEEGTFFREWARCFVERHARWQGAIPIDTG